VVVRVNRGGDHRIPVLRNDFTVDPYHVLQAAANGTDAILLIPAIPSERDMRDLRELAGLHPDSKSLHASCVRVYGAAGAVRRT